MSSTRVKPFLLFIMVVSRSPVLFSEDTEGPLAGPERRFASVPPTTA